MKEKNIQSDIMKACSQAGARVFRNNVANGLVGQMKRIEKDGPVHLNVGDWVVRNGRRTQFGLCVGSSDLIGWKTITVTPDMIGKRIAVFTALEVKTTSGSATPEQVQFVSAVANAGGMAGIVRSSDEAVAVCNPLPFF